MTTIEKMIKIIHHLISLNRKRVIAYSKGREFVDAAFLKSFFSDCVTSSEKNIADLKRVAKDFNKSLEVANEGEFSNILIKWFEGIKLHAAALETQSLLMHFNKVEDVCLKNYNRELNHNGFESFNDLSAVLLDQKKSFLTAKIKIKDLLTVMVN
ncbi:hypothetical protein [Arachidicoccus sp.]|jgi:hypothetical protein|uniref:hypothetical protein n=1 Tax=Arachidicoccus sp. TaxID=1872624 RepID=UPI003D1DD57E